MCVTVFVPIAFPGSLISTRGSRAPRANNASEEIPSPAAIPPARARPSCLDSFPCRLSRARASLSHNSIPLRSAQPHLPRLLELTDCSRSRIRAATAPAVPCAIAVCLFLLAVKWLCRPARRETSPDSRLGRFPQSRIEFALVPRASPSGCRLLSSLEREDHSATSSLPPALSVPEPQNVWTVRPSLSAVEPEPAPALAATAALHKFPSLVRSATRVPRVRAPRFALPPARRRLPARRRAPVPAPRGSSNPF